jgi:hypothetical protein
MTMLKFTAKGGYVISREVYIPLEDIRAVEVSLHPKAGSTVEENDPGLYYLTLYTNSLALTVTFNDRTIIDEIISMLEKGETRDYKTLSIAIDR